MIISSILTLGITAQVTNAIREAIVTAKYEPGQKLSETVLSEYFKVSRTPIREALKQLEREGLVEIIPRVGTCVSKPTETELNELFTLKEVLEGLAAGLFAENGKAEEIKKVQQAVTDMERALQTSDNKLYVEANSVFHETILEGAANSKLSFTLNMLLNQIPYNRYVFITIEDPIRREKSLHEHQTILSAIIKGDSEEAEKAMRDHVRASGKQLKMDIEKKLRQFKEE
ncbi:GntR family transcriptional regulator [Neobacillus vireti]|uniref:GntR family transcriptional regulator n=1 Tax=Neobacillus vireti LMG 21834 TaxID=1131730 RepID=A0AB94IGJ9_9BACI|nr:GntR family transcriptional regulator [Neobacillus vireti]ETI66237.1 GntR family transcriptional regulator [Neobacillus vireti LMG 21834]KLT19954.1 GntR family transcriptional regulator [Neobacillus vireti]